MPELREPAITLRCFLVQIGLPAQRRDQLRQDLSALGFTGFRSHGVRVLGFPRRRQKSRRQHQAQTEVASSQPHNTEPPFTFKISPVMKLARSEARKRIGPATSSAVAARPN